MPDEVPLFELLAEIKQTNLLLKLAFSDAIKAKLEDLLDEETKRIAYEATDGIKTSREISASIGVSHKTVTIWWKEWVQHGIVEPGPVRQDRPRKIINLSEVGL